MCNVGILNAADFSFCGAVEKHFRNHPPPSEMVDQGLEVNSLVFLLSAWKSAARNHGEVVSAEKWRLFCATKESKTLLKRIMRL